MTEREQSTMWLSWLAFLAGLWLIISPFILGYSDIVAATNNDLIVGVVVAVLGFVTAVWGRLTASWLSWIIALVGLWQIAAPFVLNYSGTMSATWNAVILGILILILSGWRAFSLQGGMGERYGPTFYSEERPKKEEKQDLEKKEGS